MKTSELEMFTNRELNTLDNAFDRDALPARFRNVFIGAFIAIGLAAGLVALGVSATTMAIVMSAYAVIVTLEKASYVRTAMTTRATIRKLVRRLEKVEGEPLTADGAEPSSGLSRPRGRERAA